MKIFNQKLMTLSFTLLFLFSFQLHAEQCVRLNSMDDLTIRWHGHKTMAKTAVPVEFANFELKGPARADNLEKLLKGFEIIIKTDEESITSDDEGRNFNIANFFFKEMTNGTDIKGEITSVDSHHLKLQITMNGVTKEVPMDYTFSDEKFKASGFVDVFDFNLQEQLKSITDVCAVHEGKTWSDVEIFLEAKLTDC